MHVVAVHFYLILVNKLFVPAELNRHDVAHNNAPDAHIWPQGGSRESAYCCVSIRGIAASILGQCD